MRESEFGRKIYGRLNFGIKIGSRGLRKIRRLYEIFFAALAKIFASLGKFLAFSVFVFFSSFFMFNPLENS